MSISYYEVEELARHLCGVDLDNEDVDLDDILFEKFEIYEEQFTSIVNALLPLCVVAPAALSGKMYRGFGADGVFIVKQEIAELAAVLSDPTVGGE